MDEDFASRAITIGVSVLIAIATMTVVITYYSTAKNTAVKVRSNIDISIAYNKNIENLLGLASSNNYNLTGTDVKNLLNYYYNEANVIINIRRVQYILDWTSQIVYISTSGSEKTMFENVGNNKEKYNNAIKRIIPKQYFKLEKIESNGVLTLNITGE